MELKEKLEKEIKEQNNKLERIKKAYINGVFELKEYLEDRNYIEQALNQDMSFKEIGKFLSKDPSTIFTKKSSIS